MLLKNVDVLYGKDLQHVKSTSIQVEGGVFRRTKSSSKTIDCEGLLLVPGFVNMHTHIGDSIAKDAVLSGSVDNKIHPVVGAKQKILKNTRPDHLASFMKASCLSMMKKGITTFVDFREGGIDGVLLLKKAVSKVPIRAVILGRLEYYQDKKQIKSNTPLGIEQKILLRKILKKCDGIVVSGANENSDSVLRYYSTTNKIRAIHSSETKQSTRRSLQTTKKTETARALQMRPNFLVHMTHASLNELGTAARKTRGIVVCPRANASLAEGIPDIIKMMNVGCMLAIGTDNVMINSPDMFREMDYLWKITMGMSKQRLDPKKILKMATVNGGILLGRKIGSIESGYAADGFFVDKHAVDLAPIHNPYASLVHRVTESAIRAVMVGGRIVHGKI
jgi:cytosine/adenosine deaminase-related metal-dependent hydrolase